MLGSTEDVWTQVFAKSGGRYQPPTMVLFSGAVESACGFSSAAVGPFYCPLDSKLYLDLSFFDELERRFGAPGDFAQAYVIAHEVGHHVQNQLGIAEKVQTAQQRGSQEQANALSVRMELQADCLAGVWANQSKMLEAGRRRGGSPRRQRHRRRPDPEALAGLHGAGKLDARFVGDAHAVAAPRPRQRRHQPVRHLRDGSAVARCSSSRINRGLRG